ncbi:MFS transporter [Streptomyces celluloflavus]|uniref:MFS transporter n=1 Tax=Streptomyces celluloflavus TaxID=58344 RepID=UPI003652BC20
MLASARTIAVLGNAFARVALSFAVLALPGRAPARLSLVPACQTLPQPVFILVGGVIADRMSRSRLMIAADLVGAAAYAGPAAMVLTGHAPLSAMCAPAVPAGVATALFVPATDGVVPLIVPAERLQHANGMLRVGTNSSMLLGLALSGVTVAFVGAGWAPAGCVALVVLATAAVLCSPQVRGLRAPASGTGPREGRQGGMDARAPCGQGRRDAGE